MSVVRYERADAQRAARVIPGCTGKAGMPHKNAVIAASRMRAKGLAMREYSCVFCGKWHLGTPAVR